MSKEGIVEVALKIKVPDGIKRIAFDQDGELVMSAGALSPDRGTSDKGIWSSGDLCEYWHVGIDGFPQVEVLNWKETLVRIRPKKSWAEKVYMAVLLLDGAGIEDVKPVDSIVHFYEQAGCPDVCVLKDFCDDDFEKYRWLDIDGKRYWLLWNETE